MQRRCRPLLGGLRREQEIVADPIRVVCPRGRRHARCYNFQLRAAAAVLPPTMHVNIDDYCQKKAAPAGSSAYYALRRAPPRTQPLLTALYALHRELEESVRHV